MNVYSFRLPKILDYDFLKEIHHVTLKEHISKIWGWDERQQDSFFQEEYDLGLIQIIQVSKNDVGYMILHENPDSLYVVQLLILPQYQGQGLGSQILKDLMEKAKGEGLILKLGVFKINTRAKNLYISLGLKICSETDTHYILQS